MRLFDSTLAYLCLILKAKGNLSLRFVVNLNMRWSMTKLLETPKELADRVGIHHEDGAL